jgi:RNA polymerase sigma-70 factor (ECF subfamily)
MLTFILSRYQHMQPEAKNITLYKQLVEGCLLNKRQAQYQLYELMSAKMFAVCMRYCSNKEYAQDILQEGFVKVFTNLDKFRWDGSFEGWVRRIFVNTAIEHFRKETKLFPVTDNETALMYYPVIDDLNHQLELEDLLSLVQKLSTGYRTIFNMYVIEGYSHKEIAEMLKISEGTSKSQLARARYLLQKNIQEAHRIKLPHVANSGK